MKRKGRKRNRKKSTQIYRATFIELEEMSYSGEFLALVFFLKFCEDVDECLLGKHDFPAERECVNNLGSYQCSHSRPGYIDDGETCQGKICLQ